VLARCEHGLSGLYRMHPADTPPGDQTRIRVGGETEQIAQVGIGRVERPKQALVTI